MTTFEHYTVQPILDDGTVDKSNSRTIEATSPLKAGEEALGCALSLDGRRAKALVWRLTTGYVPFSVTLYDRRPASPGTPGST